MKCTKKRILRETECTLKWNARTNIQKHFVQFRQFIMYNNVFTRPNHNAVDGFSILRSW